MQADERLKLFRNISRNYDRYRNHIRGLEDKIQVIQNKMENVHSIEYDKPSGSASFSERPVVELIEEKTVLENEKQYYEDMIAWVDGILDSFDSGAAKALIWLSCVKRRSLASIADEYGMSRDFLYKARKYSLLKALDDDVISQYDQILMRAPVQAQAHADKDESNSKQFWP